MVAQGRTAVRSPLVLIPQPFGSLVFERRTCRYLPFDVEATQLLQALAQESIDSLMERTKDRSRRKQVARFYEEFYALGFLPSMAASLARFWTSILRQIIWRDLWRCIWKSAIPVT